MKVNLERNATLLMVEKTQAKTTRRQYGVNGRPTARACELRSEVVRRVRDPVGDLVFGAFGGAVGSEERLVGLGFIFHVLD